MTACSVQSPVSHLLYFAEGAAHAVRVVHAVDAAGVVHVEGGGDAEDVVTRPPVS